MLCADCNTSLACTKGVPAYHILCRPCWQRRDRPPAHPEQMCKTCGEQWIAGRGAAQERQQCKQCWHKDVDTQDENVCRRNGCRMPLRKARYCVANQLCKSCFTEEVEKTWQTICPRLSKDEDWTEKTLFLGNLPYTCQKSDIEDFVRKQLDRPPGLPDNFEVKLDKGGKQGGHGCYNKVFKHFAHITFDIVCYAYTMLQRCDGKFFQGREVKAHPAVNPGTWSWLAKTWWRSKDWKVMDQKALDDLSRATFHDNGA